jgi:hypothetical protein
MARFRCINTDFPWPETGNTEGWKKAFNTYNLLSSGEPIKDDDTRETHTKKD